MRSAVLIFASLALASQPVQAQETGWQADAIARAVDHHIANLPEPCMEPDRSIEPASFEQQVGEETAARQALLVELPCQIGAYNQTAVYLLSDQRGTVSEVVFPRRRSMCAMPEKVIVPRWRRSLLPKRPSCARSSIPAMMPTAGR